MLEWWRSPLVVRRLKNLRDHGIWCLLTLKSPKLAAGFGVQRWTELGDNSFDEWGEGLGAWCLTASRSRGGFWPHSVHLIGFSKVGKWWPGRGFEQQGQRPYLSTVKEVRYVKIHIYHWEGYWRTIFSKESFNLTSVRIYEVCSLLSSPTA